MNNIELLSFLRFIYNKKVIVFGTGDGSQKVVPVLPCNVDYYLDNNPAKWDKQFMDSVILNPSILEKEDKDSIVILVISSFYQEIALQLTDMGFIENVHFQNALILFEDIILSSGDSLVGSNDVSASKIRMIGCVQSYAKISIDPTAIVFSNSAARFDLPGHKNYPCITIEKNSMVGCNFIFESTEGSVHIGERTFINSGVSFISRKSIKVGNDVTIGWGCCFYDHDSHSLDWRQRALDIERQRIDYQTSGNMILNKDWTTVNSKPIVIQDKVWIGFDVTILKGVTIGEGAIVGAKTVVREDVEPWTVVVGNPARVVKRLKSS